MNRFLVTFAVITALSSLQTAAASVESPKLSCVFAKEWMIFDFTELEREDDYIKDDLNFNFCKFADWPLNEHNTMNRYTFAYMLDSNDTAVALTSDNVFPDATVNRDQSDTKKWLTVKHKSKTPCGDKNDTYSFTTEVLCDERIVGQGSARILQVKDDECNVFVQVAHKSGCPKQELALQRFFGKYPWLFAILQILIGPLIAMYGRRQFPWVVSSIATLFSLYLVFLVCQVLGFTEETTGLIISLAVAIVVSFVLGYFVFKTVWIAIGVLGLMGGFSLGLMLYSVVIAFLHSGAMWAMILSAVTCSILCGILSSKYSNAVVLIMTSVIGSYAFMRGVSYFAGGYPNEAELLADLQNNLPLDDMNNMFWMYLCLFLLGSVAGIVYQIRNNDEHESLQNDVKYQQNKTDDHFERQMSVKAGGRQSQANQPNKCD